MEKLTDSTQKDTPVPIKICDLAVNTEVRGWLLAEEVQMRTTKNGKLYRHLRLRDQQGNEILAIQFELPPGEINVPQVGKVVLIEGLAEEYQHKINIKLTKAMLDETAPLDAFLVKARHSIDELEMRFRNLLHTIQHPGLQAILYNCFTNDVLEQFRRWPAAVRHHGAVVGGLLEHTVHVSMITKFLANLYPCNVELALTGALLHDIGKLQELEEQPGKGFTPEGNMFGHIFLGTLYVQQHAEQVSELDEETLLDLLHIILAHLGTKEFGSPVYPATIEALIVHLADMVEAKLTGFLDHCDRTAVSDGWISYNKEFGGPLRLP
jgi:3'-5' exoribonuclease